MCSYFKQLNVFDCLIVQLDLQDFAHFLRFPSVKLTWKMEKGILGYLSTNTNHRTIYFINLKKR